jgi:hypothetical protein
MAKKKTDALSVPRRRSTTATRRTPAAAKEAPAAVREPTFEEIAEAAYHRYLKRGGTEGTDFEDWLEAERDLRSRPKTPNSQ